MESLCQEHFSKSTLDRRKHGSAFEATALDMQTGIKVLRFSRTSVFSNPASEM
jgi:hypothetical protein